MMAGHDLCLSFNLNNGGFALVKHVALSGMTKCLIGCPQELMLKTFG